MASVPGLRYEVGSTVVPGDRLATIRTVQSGIGTYVKAGNIYASLAGKLEVVQQNTLETSESKGHGPEQTPQSLQTIQVKPFKPIASLQLLMVGQVAIGRVIRITMMQAIVEILATTSFTGESILLSEPQQGIIRREDVRSGASEQVLIHESFLPGDLVICKVLALDQRRYVLATSEPELGVLYAESRTSGLQMVPSSWKEMSCPETGTKEVRKCARPRVLGIGETS
jgi:exosome complex component CSL4